MRAGPFAGSLSLTLQDRSIWQEMTASTLLHVLLFGLIVYLQPYLPVLSQVDGEPAVTMVEIADKEVPPGEKEKEPVVKETATEQEPAADSATSEEGEGVEAAEDEVSSDDSSTEGEGAETGPDQNAGDSEQPPLAEEPTPPPVPEPEAGTPSAAGTEETEPLGGGAEDASETPSGTEPTPEAGLPGGGAEPLEGGDAALLANDVSVYGTALTETVTIPDGEDVRVVPGVGEGIPATLNDDRYDWKGYIQSMLVLLDRAITPRLPSEIDPRTDDPIVSVVVMRDGSVRSVKMLRSSGVQEIDDAVLAGLSTRMPRLPEKWPARAARIPLLFRLPTR